MSESNGTKHAPPSMHEAERANDGPPSLHEQARASEVATLARVDQHTKDVERAMREVTKLTEARTAVVARERDQDAALRERGRLVLAGHSIEIVDHWP